MVIAVIATAAVRAALLANSFPWTIAHPWLDGRKFMDALVLLHHPVHPYLSGEWDQAFLVSQLHHHQVPFQVFPASNLPHTHAHTVWATRHRAVYDYGFYDTVHLSYVQRVIKVNMTRLIEVRTPRECPCGGTQLQLLLHARCPPTIVMRSSDIKLLIITSYGSVCCN